jgi:hypothetical protein
LWLWRGREITEQTEITEQVEFTQLPEGIRITEAFEPEEINPEARQASGWQAMLDNFKKYVESIA